MARDVVREAASWRSQIERRTSTVPYEPCARADSSSSAPARAAVRRLTAAARARRSTLVSARPLAETASYWAQGGAAAALALDDSPSSTSRTR
jgi:hypothetical protein